MTNGEDSAESATEDDATRLRKLFSGACDFLLGVAALDQLPPGDRPEVAFAGRSNVGKSSLLNALTNRKALARTSITPGRTREINFFLLGGNSEEPGDPSGLYLVDLPGYGYARVSRGQVLAWTRLLKDYLKGRANLRRAFLLVDSRHGLKDTDRQIMTLLDEAAVSYQIVLTKTDKVKDRALAEIASRVAEETRKHPACHPELLQTSALKGRGIDDLRAAVAGIMAIS
ncbi:MAG: YihA family ribosome biogenesis GTP-binding protein [Proteobacteria bacterium]|nr:YihA family ribosome biogenesis GTP-binding protein [Pseudomonadota bacterium]